MQTNKLSKISKFSGFIALTVMSVWLGSYITKLFTLYYFFEGPELQLASFFNESSKSGLLQTLLPVFLIQFISYFVFVAFFLIFLITSKLSLKYNGWLFIILVVVIATLPFEIYLMKIDYDVIVSLQGIDFNPDSIITLLKNRITELSSYPLLAVFSYMSFYYFIIFQPLTKNRLQS